MSPKKKVVSETDPSKEGLVDPPVMDEVEDDFIPYLGTGIAAFHGVPAPRPQDPEQNPWKVPTVGVQYSNRPPEEAVVPVRIVQERSGTVLDKWRGGRYYLTSTPQLIVPRNELRTKLVLQVHNETNAANITGAFLSPSPEECFDGVAYELMTDGNQLVMKTGDTVWASIDPEETDVVFLTWLEEYQVVA